VANLAGLNESTARRCLNDLRGFGLVRWKPARGKGNRSLVGLYQASETAHVDAHFAAGKTAHLDIAKTAHVDIPKTAHLDERVPRRFPEKIPEATPDFIFDEHREEEPEPPDPAVVELLHAQLSKMRGRSEDVFGAPTKMRRRH
jgi:hypothetical protein